MVANAASQLKFMTSRADAQHPQKLLKPLDFSDPEMRLLTFGKPDHAGPAGEAGFWAFRQELLTTQGLPNLPIATLIRQVSAPILYFRETKSDLQSGLYFEKTNDSKRAIRPAPSGGNWHKMSCGWQGLSL